MLELHRRRVENLIKSIKDEGFSAEEINHVLNDRGCPIRDGYPFGELAEAWDALGEAERKAYREALQ